MQNFGFLDKTEKYFKVEIKPYIFLGMIMFYRDFYEPDSETLIFF